MMPPAPHKWLSRGEWAKERRTMHWDEVPNISDRIADYATPVEIEALRNALRGRLKALGPRWKRRSINRALNRIRCRELPITREDYMGADDILTELQARYVWASADASERKKQEIAQRPIDDDAWNAELRRRARVDKHLAKARRGQHIS